MNNIIQGKAINFNEEVSNLNLIQNKNLLNIEKSALKEEFEMPYLFSPSKTNFNFPNKKIQQNPNPSFPPQKKLNLPPDAFEPNFLNQSDKINNSNKKINVPSEQKNKTRLNNTLQENSQKCTCTRTQCQKKYCYCFSRGIPCQGCECKGCLNLPKIKNEINGINNNIYQDMNINYQTTGCNCSKSHCLKKYCECFKIGLGCTNHCRCVDCKNMNINKYLNNKENINNENVMNNNIINEEDIIDNEIWKEISKKYKINAFEIFILNKNLVIKDRYIDLTLDKMNINTTPKLTNKKRSRTGNSTMRTCPTTNSNSRRRRNYVQVNSNVKTKKLIIN